jgi:hypothetical protein
MSEAERLALRDRLSRELALKMEASKLEVSPTAPPTARYILGVRIEQATVNFYGQLFGVPLGVCYTCRYFGKAHFLWRHARVPYSDGKVLRLCRKYDLPSAQYMGGKMPGDATWQAAARQGVLSVFGTLALVRFYGGF